MPTVQRKHRKRGDGRKHRTAPVGYSARIGLYAGILIGLLRWLLYTFHFTKVLPGFLVDPFFRVWFLRTGWGGVIGVASFAILSIAAALLYYALLGRIAGPWPGLFYGALWWWALFMALGPLLGMLLPIYRIGYTTIWTELCLFLIWGLFIGYSIAYEFNDEASREPAASRKPSLN